MATMERARPPAAKMAPTKSVEKVRLCSLIKPSQHVIGFYWRFSSKLFAVGELINLSQFVISCSINVSDCITLV